MQDLDKQLQGMKQNVTGVQAWNTDTTTYYKASGDDTYDYACGKHKADEIFEASNAVKTEGYSNILGITLNKKSRQEKKQAKSGNCDAFTDKTPLKNGGGIVTCVNGSPFYPTGANSLTLANWEKEMNRCICAKRKDGKNKSDEPSSTNTSDTENKEKTSIPEKPIVNLPSNSATPSNTNQSTSNSSTGKILIIGFSIVLLGTLGFFLLRRK